MPRLDHGISQANRIAFVRMKRKLNDAIGDHLAYALGVPPPLQFPADRIERIADDFSARIVKNCGLKRHCVLPTKPILQEAAANVRRKRDSIPTS